jgi:hypothetical protein
MFDGPIPYRRAVEPVKAGMMPPAGPPRRSMREGTPQDELEAVRDAYRTTVGGFAAARSRMADRVAEAERRHREYRAWAERRIADLERENDVLRREIVGKDDELQSVLNTKTFRYTTGLRNAYGRVRSLFRR